MAGNYMVKLPIDWQISLTKSSPGTANGRQAMTFGTCFAGMETA
jgi:hypothetical protein